MQEMEEVVCELPDYNPPSEEVQEILRRYRKIAVVGLSTKPERDSYRVARYLMENGFDITPVNPGHKEILGKRCYASLKDIPYEIEVVDIFLNPKRIPPVVDQAIEIGAKVIWMQLGLAHNESAKKARNAGIQVVMNMCIMQEFEKMKKNQML